MVPPVKELIRGYKAFQANVPRDATYKTASFLVEHFWEDPRQIADGLGASLLTWNQAFYRYGHFDFDRLEKCITRNRASLTGFRHRRILDFTEQDAKPIRRVFSEFLAALEMANGSKKGARSPVATAKALHLMAPDFFPLWDVKIARGYHCNYSKDPDEVYLRFFRQTRAIAEALSKTFTPRPDKKTLLKLIDEYNYAKHTKGWV
jgi:hypothetical protein